MPCRPVNPIEFLPNSANPNQHSEQNDLFSKKKLGNRFVCTFLRVNARDLEVNFSILSWAFLAQSTAWICINGGISAETTLTPLLANTSANSICEPQIDLLLLPLRDEERETESLRVRCSCSFRSCFISLSLAVIQLIMRSNFSSESLNFSVVECS